MSKALELGPLELKVLKALWQQRCASTVRHLQAAFPKLAYTTLMTTLDRLHRKGLLRRSRLGRAFSYEPDCSQDELLGQMVSTLVRAVRQADIDVLDELEALVRAERWRLKSERSS